MRRPTVPLVLRRAPLEASLIKALDSAKWLAFALLRLLFTRSDRVRSRDG